MESLGEDTDEQTDRPNPQNFLGRGYKKSAKQVNFEVLKSQMKFDKSI